MKVEANLEQHPAVNAAVAETVTSADEDLLVSISFAPLVCRCLCPALAQVLSLLKELELVGFVQLNPSAGTRGELMKGDLTTWV